MCSIIGSDFFKALGGTFTDIVITGLSIYQFIRYSFDGQNVCIKVVLFTWLASKILSLFAFLFSKNRSSLYLFGLIFQSEWIFSGANNDSQLYMKVFIQIMMLVIPMNLCNFYLLSEKSLNITHGYYIAIVLINYLFINYAIRKSIQAHMPNNDNIQGYLAIPASILHFCFFYSIMQSFTYHWAIGLSIIVFNLLMMFIDLIFFKLEKLMDEESDKSVNTFFRFTSYLLQVNPYIFKIYGEHDDCIIKSWRQIFQLSIQFLNVIILAIIKFIKYPYIIRFDLAYYIFLALSVIYLITLFFNIYYRIAKQNSYALLTQISDIRAILNKDLPLITDRFTNHIQVSVEINYSQLKKGNSQEFLKGINTITQFYKQVKKNQGKQYFIEIYEKNFLFRFVITNMSTLFRKLKAKEVQQILEIDNDTLFSRENYGEIVQIISQITDIVNDNQNPDIDILLINSKIKDYIKVVSSIQTFKQFNYYLITKQKEINLDQKVEQELEAILKTIANEQLSKLAFFKQVSPFLNVNPSLVLYDFYN